MKSLLRVLTTFPARSHRLPGAAPGVVAQTRAWVGGLFGVRAPVAAPVAPKPAPRTAKSSAPKTKTPPPSPRASAPSVAPAPASVPASVPPVPPAPTSVEPCAGADELALPLSLLVAAFPAALQKRVLTKKIPGTTILLPKEKLLTQLAQGLVMVTFGEIRRSAPEVFHQGAELDDTVIMVPPKELVLRLGPAVLQRRAQKKVELPAAITSPFGDQRPWSVPVPEPTENSLTPPPEERSAAAYPSAPAPLPAGGVSELAPPPAPEPEPEPLPDVPPIPMPIASVSLVTEPVVEECVAETILLVSAPESEPTPTPATLPPEPAWAMEDDLEVLPDPSGWPVHPVAALSEFMSPAPDELPEPLAPAVVAVPVEETVPEPVVAALPEPSDAEHLLLPLAALAKDWPQSVRLEIAHWELPEAKIALPIGDIEPGLKRGRLSFAWRQLRACTYPAPPSGLGEHDDLPLELPLSVVAKSFFARQRARAASSPPPPPPAPAEVAPEMVAETSSRVRETTPQDVVLASLKLPGVDGALVALPDGLRVASRVDDSMDGDLLAAMLPQVYSNMRAWTKEMRLGELSELTFNAGTKSWNVIRVNGLFFAAFGRAGTRLPGDALARLASQLNTWGGN